MDRMEMRRVGPDTPMGRLMREYWIPAATSAELVAGGAPVRLMVLTDLTERVAAENRLRAAAHYDALTELPNRVLLQDRLSHALAMATRNQRLMALIVADLDGFKAVNDAHGHAAGDAALREVARRFSACVRDADTLARVGGDEFVIVMPEVARREDAALLACGWSKRCATRLRWKARQSA